MTCDVYRQCGSGEVDKMIRVNRGGGGGIGYSCFLS